MFCNKCGKEIPDNSTFCNHCGTKLQQTSGPVPQGFHQPGYPPPINQQHGYPHQGYVPGDGPIGSLGIVCFMFPIVGLILYLVWKDTTPIKGKGAGKWALWGVAASFLFFILYVVFVAVIAGSAFSSYY
jgi:hypothetical protein